jgi:hypothetical protein
MKNFLILLSLILTSTLIISCHKVEYGEAHGNVYYKYNDFVGHKPDVGSSVEYWAKDSTSEVPVYRTTTDVNGDFKLPKIITGEYFVVIKSAKQRSCPKDALNNMVYYKKQLKNIFKVDLDKQKNIDDFLSLKKEIDLLWKKELDKGVDKFSTKLSNLEQKQDSVATLILKNLSSVDKMSLNMGGPYSNKIEYKNVTIKITENTKLNVDFDITCF